MLENTAEPRILERTTSMLIPVILCGGSGTRLWPVSRHYYPKQFHALIGPVSLFQQTVQRCLAGASGPPVVLTNSEYRFMVLEQLDGIGVAERTIVLEPTARNTAPAIALAALYIAETSPDAVMLVAPSDHLIRDQVAFAAAIDSGCDIASGGRLVTLGIEPTFPATGYGYIECASSPEPALPGTGRRVQRFVEKPDLSTARQFVEQGGYYWNSGLFLFTAAVYLEELEKYAPDILTICERSRSASTFAHGFTAAGACYADAPALSVDYAIMEKTERAVVLPFAGDWSDIGSWSGLSSTGQCDANGNTVSGNVRLHNVTDSVIFASDRLVAGVGLKNAVIVETKDAVLISTQEGDQQVKQVVDMLRTAGAPEVDFHTRVLRPWGSYENLDGGDGFLVKRLTIKPGASISLQRHFHRAEHWVVVRGEANVVRGDQSLVLGKNESTDIPMRTVHKLSNRGTEDLVIIEVQTGDSLVESDIERLHDDYGRA